jgi:hypothetical protein
VVLLEQPERPRVPAMAKAIPAVSRRFMELDDLTKPILTKSGGDGDFFGFL